MKSIAANPIDSSRSLMLTIAPAAGSTVQPIQVKVVQAPKSYTVNGLDTREIFFGNLYFVNNNFDTPNPFGAYVKNEEYFASTDIALRAPFNEKVARSRVKDVDIMYFGVYDYSGIGFIDPYTASQNWYWDYAYRPWLDSSKKLCFTLLNSPKLILIRQRAILVS